MSKQRTYTELDLRLGLVKLSPEQQQIITERVVPILARGIERELKRLAAEQGGATHGNHALILHRGRRQTGGGGGSRSLLHFVSRYRYRSKPFLAGIRCRAAQHNVE
ncbi:MAG: hypothetical protein ACOY94_06025 [Bacillota bacterium]